MQNDRNLYAKQRRYVIQSWVCGFGIYDVDNDEFIGIPLHTYTEAVAVLLWLTNYFNIKDL